MEEAKLLEYVPFSSLISPSFWHKYTDIKLDVDGLRDEERRVWGYFSCVANPAVTQAILEVDSTSFNTEFSGASTTLPAHGFIVNKNTVEEFKEVDKGELVSEWGSSLWRRIRDRTIDVFEDTSLLNAFFILSFADIKKYHFYYWFCFPTPARIKVTSQAISSIGEHLAEEARETLCKGYFELEMKQRSYFIVRKNEGTVFPLKHILTLGHNFNAQEYFFGFADPSTVANYPGWNLRNFIAFLIQQFEFLREKDVAMLSFRLNRNNGKTMSCTDSLVIQLTLPKVENVFAVGADCWVGWEKNERGKFGPKLANLKNSLDPKHLANASVDLNLRLMKWQLLPGVDIEKIKSCKFLLLGAGTLGCSVARTLLGWGARNITFVDSGVVNYSNPVRQSLYFYDDCIKNLPKAETAAKNVKKIFPGVNSVGHMLTIPMPGHPIGASVLEQTKHDIDVLSQLVLEHDVMFLLMDSRESRWLPTVLGSYFGKIVINAALGFDTYLVMRHGFRSNEQIREDAVEMRNGIKRIPGDQLGCYFCNDVTAPGNSMKHRTLDQQCTVTRPGVSAIAGALAVELAVAILHHKHGARASAFYKATNNVFEDEELEEGLLGILPHSIRGFLTNFTQVLPATEKYKQCVACSDTVLNAYKTQGVDFLLKVFDSCKFLEELTGLNKIVYQDIDLEEFDLSDSE